MVEMVKIIREHGIKYFIGYLNLKSYLVSGLIILAADICVWLIMTCAVCPTSILYRIGHIFVSVFAVFLWAGLLRNHVQQKVYYYHQKRDYKQDARYTGKKFSELSSFYKDADPAQMDVEKLPEKHWTESGGIVLGKIGRRLIEFEPDGNGIVAMVWGAPGDGKTSSVIIPSCRQFGMHRDPATGMRRQNGAVMVTDLKGDIYSANRDYRTIKRFSTMHPEESAHYDPLTNARKMEPKSRAICLENMAITLVPDEGEGDSQYFVSGAREYFTGICLYSLNQDNSVSFPTIIERIVKGNAADWVKTIMESDDQYAKAYTNHFFGENFKNVAGTYSHLVSSVRLFDSDALRILLTDDGNCISPQDLENSIDIYIQIDPNQIALYSPVISMLFQDFMSSMLYRKEGQNPAIAFVIDEFGQIPAMPVISQSAALMRAYNCSLLFSCQSLAMIDKHYGQAGRKILMDCVKAHCFLSINDPDTREWASRLFGTRKVLKVTDSQQVNGHFNINQGASSGRSVTETRERIFEPEYFGYLPQKDANIIYYNGMYLEGKKTYYFKE